MLKFAINKTNPNILFKFVEEVKHNVGTDPIFGTKTMYKGFKYEGSTETEVLIDSVAFGNEWLGIANAALDKVLDTATENLDADIVAGNIKEGITIFDVTGTLVELVGEEIEVDATVAEQVITPSEGKNGITEITVNPVTAAIDENIVSGNIKSGVTILGVEGASTVVDVSDTDAVAGDVAAGKFFYTADGTKTEGTAV